SRFLTARTQQILQRAGRFALERGQTELDALHILRTIVEDEGVAEAIRHIGADPAAIAAAVEARLPQSRGSADVDAAMLTASASRALFHAYHVARSSGSTYVDPEHLFFALVLGKDVPAGQILARAGVTAEALTQNLRSSVAGASGSAQENGQAASDTPMLDQFGLDLTARAREG